MHGPAVDLPGVREISLVAHDNNNHILATLISDIVNPPRYCLKACSIYSMIRSDERGSGGRARAAWREGLLEIS